MSANLRNYKEVLVFFRQNFNMKERFY